MDVWEKFWEFSPETEDRLTKMCLKIQGDNPSEISSDWLALLNYNSSLPDNCQMEVDDSENNKKEEILKSFKHCVENETDLPETTFVGISLNSLSRILLSLNSILDEFGFCSFCRFIASWNNDTLVEHSLRLVVFEKLKESSEASGCIIFSIKELAISKPSEVCQNVLIPLLTDETFDFTDVELLSGVFSILPTPQRDLIIRKISKKSEFFESDWKLLHPLLKDLSQNNLMNLLNCIQKFSGKFTKSSVFGKFLVNFCKNFEFSASKDALQEVVEKHETLLRAQAMKYLESMHSQTA